MQTTSVQPTHGPMPAPIGPARGISIKPATTKAGSSAVRSAPLCLFGQDSNGRFHGASFLGHDVAAVERAADLMDLYCVAADTDPLRDLAAALPTGRLFANSGKAFVPFIKADLYQRLLAATDTPDEPRPSAAASKPAEAPPPAGAGSGGKGGADAPGGVPKAPPDWASIGIGSTVLACQGPMEGWWEAVVMYTKADDRFVLRWRDFPDEPEIARARKDVALMPPGSREGLG